MTLGFLGLHVGEGLGVGSRHTKDEWESVSGEKKVLHLGRSMVGRKRDGRGPSSEKLPEETVAVVLSDAEVGDPCRTFPVHKRGWWLVEFSDLDLGFDGREFRVETGSDRHTVARSRVTLDLYRYPGWSLSILRPKILFTNFSQTG